VVAVDEGDVEGAALAEEARQRKLRFLLVVLHYPSDPRLLEELQAQAREPPRLVGVDGDVAGHSFAGVREQAFADVQRREAVAEAYLDRARRLLAYDPIPQRLPLGGAHRDREEVVDRAVRVGDGGAIANEALDHTANPSQRRASISIVNGVHASAPPRDRLLS